MTTFWRAPGSKTWHRSEHGHEDWDDGATVGILVQCGRYLATSAALSARRRRDKLPDGVLDGSLTLPPGARFCGNCADFEGIVYPTPTRRHDPTDHDCRGGVEGDRFAF